jgi:hypothetical protein
MTSATTGENVTWNCAICRLSDNIYFYVLVLFVPNYMEKITTVSIIIIAVSLEDVSNTYAIITTVFI